MGCSSSRPVNETPQLRTEPRKLESREALPPSIAIPAFHPVRTAQAPNQMSRHSLSNNEGSEHTSSGGLRDIQRANDADNPSTSSIPPSTIFNEASGPRPPAGDEDMSVISRNHAAPAGPIPESSTPSTPTIACDFCCENIHIGDDIIMTPCSRCNSNCCGKCIRKLFVDACKSESDMPPRCCKPIPLAFARALLSEDEITLFKERYEEWSTPNRIYCPVPTCSAFIPHRLFPFSTQTGGDTKESKAPAGRLQNPTVVFGTGVKMEIHTPPPTPPSSSPTPRHSYSLQASASTIKSIPCPKCAVEICCSCKQLSHHGSPCSGVQDIDPELESHLRRWGFKRCPKCHAAVRRMYGCSHMQCRCGAQWCWFCTGPIAICHRRPCPQEDESERLDREINTASSRGFGREESEDVQDGGGEREQPETPAPSTAQLENLDAGWNWEDEEADFGEEPNLQEIDPLECKHTWETVMESEVDSHLVYDCERCWRRIVPQSYTSHYLGIKELIETGSFQEQPASESEASFGENATMQRCEACGLTLCLGCRDEAKR